MGWLLAMLAACNSRPDDASDWEGCLYEGSRLDVDRDIKALHPVAGEGDVLALGASWGGFPFVMDTETSGSLVVDLGPAGTGASIDLAVRPSEYREGAGHGGMRLVGAVSGAVVVLAREGETARVRVDAEVGGGRAVTGEVVVRRCSP